MELLNRIQKELKVPKSQYNAFAKYNYRNCEDILEAVKPLLGSGVLTLSDEMVEVGGRCYVKATAELAWPPKSGGTEFGRAIATGYAREALDKKGMDEAQITGAASSYARKYALCGLFCIDDGDEADKQDNTQEKVTSSKKMTVIVPPKKVADKRDTLKARIKELVDGMVLVPLTTGGEYKDYVLEATGFELVPDNFDIILRSLEDKKENNG